MLDFSGYGFSHGERAFSTHQELFEDLILALKEVRKDIPLFAIGHSQGGGILLGFFRLNSNFNLAGVICSNPFIDFPEKQNVKSFERVLIHYVPHKLLLTSANPPIDPFQLAKNSQVI